MRASPVEFGFQKHLGFIMAGAVLAPVITYGAATRVFHDEFERGIGPGWVQVDGRNLPKNSSVAPRSGTNCLSFNWNGTVAWNTNNRYESIRLPSFPYNSVAFLRFYIKISPDMDDPQDSSGPKIFKFGDRNEKEVYLWPEMDAGRLRAAPNCNGCGLTAVMSTFWGSSDSSLFPPGTWKKVEIYLAPNMIKLWVGDTLCKVWDIDTNVGGTWYPLTWASNWSGEPGTRDHDESNHLFVDSFEVFSDSSAGTPTTGSMINGDIEAITGGSPEINVSGNNIAITDGDTTPQLADHTDFGSMPLGQEFVRTFTVTNTGNANLAIGTVSISGPQSSDFRIKTQPQPTISPGGRTAFTVALTPQAPGPRIANLTFANNDANENPFDFAIKGAGTYNSIGRVGHWRFDEASGDIASDSSGNNSAGRLQNGPYWTNGVLGGAIILDGFDDVVVVGRNAYLNNLPALTITAWIRPSSAGEGAFGRITHKGSGINPNGGHRFLIATNGQLRFGADYATTDLERFSRTNTVLFGVWQHVTVTWDGSPSASGVRFYVNGNETQYSGTLNGTGLRGDDSSSDLYIGNNGAHERTFDGALDEVRMYDKALSPSEVQLLFNESNRPRIDRIVRSGGMVTIYWNGQPGLLLQRRALQGSVWYDVFGSEGASSVTEPIDTINTLYRLVRR